MKKNQSEDIEEIKISDYLFPQDVNRILKEGIQIPSQYQHFLKAQEISNMEKDIFRSVSQRFVNEDMLRQCKNKILKIQIVYKLNSFEQNSKNCVLSQPVSQIHQYQNANLHLDEHSTHIDISPEDVVFIFEEVIIPAGKLIYRGAKSVVGGVGQFFGWLFKDKEENVSQSKKSNETSNVKQTKKSNQTNKGNQTPKGLRFKSNEEVSKALIEGVEATESGKCCTRAVMNALKGKTMKKLGDKGCGFNNPPEAENELIKQQYKKVEKGVQPRVGTIRIFRPIQGHPDGHIQVYCKDNNKYKDGIWISDFKQNNADVYGVKSDYQDYYKETKEDEK